VNARSPPLLKRPGIDDARFQEWVWIRFVKEKQRIVEARALARQTRLPTIPRKIDPTQKPEEAAAGSRRAYESATRSGCVVAISRMMIRSKTMEQVDQRDVVGRGRKPGLSIVSALSSLFLRTGNPSPYAR
jgi:hypothetical protein